MFFFLQEMKIIAIKMIEVKDSIVKETAATRSEK